MLSLDASEGDDAGVGQDLDNGPSTRRSLTLRVMMQEWDKIWTINKKIIDPVCPRHTAISDLQRVNLHLTNGPQSPEVISVPKNKKHPPAGLKATTQSQVRAAFDTSANVDMSGRYWQGRSCIMPSKWDSPP